MNTGYVVFGSPIGRLTCLIGDCMSGLWTEDRQASLERAAKVLSEAIPVAFDRATQALQVLAKTFEKEAHLTQEKELEPCMEEGETMSQNLINLSNESYTDRRHKEVLSHIRETYGNTTQILVSNEELCELAAVCAKFPRYTDPRKARTELHSAAIDEVADVMIILDHIINIFELSEEEVWSRIEGKVDRIRRWLANSDSQEQTTVDREVHEGREFHAPCGKCTGFGDFNNLKPGHRCCICVTSNYSMFKLRLEENADDS